MAEIGNVIGGRYLVRGNLGAGSTARVYLVWDQKEGKEYALKEISDEELGRIGAMTECSVREKLFHPGLVHLWKAWKEQGKFYLLMDYVRGISLQELLRQKGALPQERAVDIAMQMGRALVYLHGFHPPIIYRDLKPTNMILREDGSVVLIDLGAAKQLKRRGRRDKLPLGTMGYAAPEQYGRHAHSDQRSDLYSLGVILYYMLTGHDPGEPPYRMGRIREWNKELSPELERIVCKCTRKWPVWRFQSGEEFIKALEGYREADRKRLDHKLRKLLEKFA